MELTLERLGSFPRAAQLVVVELGFRQSPATTSGEIGLGDPNFKMQEMTKEEELPEVHLQVAATGFEPQSASKCSVTFITPLFVWGTHLPPCWCSGAISWRGAGAGHGSHE